MSSTNLFSYDTFVRAISGAAGGVTAMSVFFPLDTIRSRLQVEDARAAKNTIASMQDLINDEGIASLYRGIEPVLISLCCSNFVYFYSFHGLRRLLIQNASYNPLKDLGVGSVAGIINVLTTTPLWVANSRLKMQGAKVSPADQKNLGKRTHYNGIIDALKKIAAADGLMGLWSGMIPSLWLVCNPAIQFTVYEALKVEFSKILGHKNMNAMTYFLIGALSKSVSTVLTYPIQIVQQKLRYGSESLKKLTMLQIFTFIIQTQGVRGLFKGLEAKLLQTCLTAALMFLCYEKIVTFIFYLLKVNPNK